MLTHDNIYSNVMADARQIPFAGDDVCLSFLPLSHIFERMAGHYLMFAHGHEHRLRRVDRHGAAEHDGGAADARALGAATVREDVCARARERARRAARSRSGSSSGRAASPTGGPTSSSPAGRPRGLLALQYAHRAEVSVLETPGSAPADGCATSSRAARRSRRRSTSSSTRPGLVILEGYGLTETSPVIAVNTPDDFRIGTVGKPVAGVEVMIASDGEILTRGPHVMKGYYNKPDGDGRSDRRRRLVPHRRHRRAARRIPRDHRSQEGHHRHGGRQEHRAAADREQSQDEQVREPGRDDRRQAQVPGHARRAELGFAREVGEAAEHSLDRPRAAARHADGARQDGEGGAMERCRASRTTRCRRRSGCSSTTSRSSAASSRRRSRSSVA